MTPRRETLSLRHDGVERLLTGLPVDVDDLNDVRRYARALISAASAWEIERNRMRAAERGNRGRA